VVRSSAPRAPLALLALVGLVALVGCSGLDGGDKTAATTTVAPVVLSASPLPGATDAPVDKPVSISVTEGTLSAVLVTSSTGPLAGKLTPDATSWTSTDLLVPSATYQVGVNLVDLSGVSTPKQWQFTTVAPAAVFKATLSPVDDAVVGVGMPVIVKLSSPIGPHS
jgi:hypothetical protein